MTNKITDCVQDGYTLEEEIFAWEMMCGKGFEEFIQTPERKRRAEDYGKYIGISILFRFKRIFLRLFNDCEGRLDEILAYMTTKGRKVQVAEGWIREALCNIPDRELRKIVADYWNELKEKCGNGELDFGAFF